VSDELAATAYDRILAALDSVPWSAAPEITPIRPLARKSIDFFPGQCGFTGADFPTGGIMMVGNNFSTVKGWNEYREWPDIESTTATWRKLRLIVEASELPIDKFWFTNYCLGAMINASESYDFPRRIIKALQLDRAFCECVAVMKPRLIVSLGGPAAKYLGTDFQYRHRVDQRTIAGHPTRLLAIVHPSGWTWGPGGRGFSDDDFREEGKRIGRAASAP
jgi:hypothetical protein